MMYLASNGLLDAKRPFRSVRVCGRSSAVPFTKNLIKGMPLGNIISLSLDVYLCADVPALLFKRGTFRIMWYAIENGTRLGLLTCEPSRTLDAVLLGRRWNGNSCEARI